MKKKMPFASKLQLQTCFSRNLSILAQGKVPKWDCKKWLDKTENPACLPTRSGEKPPKNCKKRKPIDAEDLTKFYRGEKGGLYFFVDGIKLYVPADAKDYVEQNFEILLSVKK